MLYLVLTAHIKMFFHICWCFYCLSVLAEYLFVIKIEIVHDLSQSGLFWATQIMLRPDCIMVKFRIQVSKIGVHILTILHL